jgi:hypothetical protein
MNEYNAREHRLTSVTSRVRDVFASLEQCEESRQEQRAWLARNRVTLDSWSAALSRYRRRMPSAVPIEEARDFARWARRQRWTNWTLLKLRWQCRWLSVRVLDLEASRRMSAMLGRDRILIVVAMLFLFGLIVLLIMA